VHDTDNDGIIDKAKAIHAVLTAGGTKYYGTLNGEVGVCEFPASSGVSKTYVDDADAAIYNYINGLTGTSTSPIKIISFSAGYQGLLNYKPYGKWSFADTIFEATSTISLNAADANFDRIDLLVLTSVGTIIKVTGIPAENPVEPSIDEATQIKAAFILIKAGATVPADVSLITIFNENTGTAGGEFNASVSAGGARWDLNNTEDPYTGTKAIKATALQQYDKVNFTPPAYIDPAKFLELTFYIKNLAAAPAENPIDFTLFGNTTSNRGRGTATVYMPPMSSYGYDPLNVTDWQFIAIPVPPLSLSEIQTVSLYYNKAGNFSFLMDAIKYNDGSAPTGDEFATVGWVMNYAEPKLPTAPGTVNTLVINADGSKTWTGEILTSTEKTKLATLGKNTIQVSVSRLLTADDHRRKIHITAPITLTWPAGGIADFEVNFDIGASGALTIADQAGTPGNDLDAPAGKVLEAAKMGHAYARPDDGKLRLKGDWKV
jgi:hypothetical protein